MLETQVRRSSFVNMAKHVQQIEDLSARKADEHLGIRSDAVHDTTAFCALLVVGHSVPLTHLITISITLLRLLKADYFQCRAGMVRETRWSRRADSMRLRGMLAAVSTMVSQPWPWFQHRYFAET